MLILLLVLPLLGIFFISSISNKSMVFINNITPYVNLTIPHDSSITSIEGKERLASRVANGTYLVKNDIKMIALTASILNLLISLVLFILFDFSSNQFQFVQEPHDISGFNFYLGVDGISIYFVLLTTIIIPIALLSN